MSNLRFVRALACLGLALLPMLLATVGQSARAQALPFYSVTDLGPVGAAGVSTLGLSGTVALTDAGDMAINYPDANGDLFGYVLIGGVSTPIPLDLPGRVRDMNGDGLAVGRVGQPATGGQPDYASFRAFTYQDGTVTELPALEGGEAAAAIGVNERGVVVGTSAVEGGSLAAGDAQRAVVWKNGKVTSLGTLGGEWSLAYDVNEDGAVVGISALEDGEAVHPFIYRSRKDVVDLGTLGGSCYYTFRINEGGQAAGSCAVDEGSGADSNVADDVVHAVLWDGEELLDLGVLPDGTGSAAFDLADDGTVVGASFVPVGGADAQGAVQVQGRAVAWVDGTCYDLNAQIDASLGITLISSNAINDQGQIAALGAYAGSPDQINLFLLTPAV